MHDLLDLITRAQSCPMSEVTFTGVKNRSIIEYQIPITNCKFESW